GTDIDPPMRGPPWGHNRGMRLGPGAPAPSPLSRADVRLPRSPDYATAGPPSTRPGCRRPDDDRRRGSGRRRCSATPTDGESRARPHPTGRPQRQVFDRALPSEEAITWVLENPKW